MAGKVIAIVAADLENTIGSAGSIPWRLPTDMKHFKSQTLGHQVIMGRKTFESLPLQYRPLAGRTNIILTRSEDYKVPGATVVHSVAEALNMDSLGAKYVIGGAEIYGAFLPFTEEIFLTRVNARLKGDTTLPFNPDKLNNFLCQFFAPCVYRDADLVFPVLA